MNDNEDNEEFFKEIEEYIKEFHIENGADDKTANMLGKIGSYWNRTNTQRTRGYIVRELCKRFNDLIDEYKLLKQLNNYEVLCILYTELEKIIEIEENKRQLQKEIKYQMSGVDGAPVLRITYNKE